MYNTWHYDLNSNTFLETRPPTCYKCQLPQVTRKPTRSLPLRSERDEIGGTVQ